MKYKKDYFKVLDKRYKSTVDDGIHETNLQLIEAFDPEINDYLVYVVMSTYTFNDGVETYDQGYDSKMFDTLSEATDYFNEQAVDMYKDKEDELMSLFKVLLPKKESKPVEDTEFKEVDVFN